jgi:hypothetical protein
MEAWRRNHLSAQKEDRKDWPTRKDVLLTTASLDSEMPMKRGA